MLELDGKVDLVANESFNLAVSSTREPYDDCDEVWADDDLDIVYASGEGYGAWTRTEGFSITNEYEAVFLFAEARGAVAGRGLFSDVSGGAGACAGGYFNLENHWDDGYPFPLWVTTARTGRRAEQRLLRRLPALEHALGVRGFRRRQRAADAARRRRSRPPTRATRACAFRGGARLGPCGSRPRTSRASAAGLAIGARAAPPRAPGVPAVAAGRSRPGRDRAVGSVEMKPSTTHGLGDPATPRYPVGFAIEAYDTTTSTRGSASAA